MSQWTTDGKIVFTKARQQTWSVSPVGGEPEPFASTATMTDMPWLALDRSRGTARRWRPSSAALMGCISLWTASPTSALKPYEPAPFASRSSFNAPVREVFAGRQTNPLVAEHRCRRRSLADAVPAKRGQPAASDSPGRVKFQRHADGVVDAGQPPCRAVRNSEPGASTTLSGGHRVGRAHRHLQRYTGAELARGLAGRQQAGVSRVRRPMPTSFRWMWPRPPSHQ